MPPRGLGIDKKAVQKTLYHGMIGEAEASDLIVNSDIDLLKVIPSRVELIGFEVEMMAEDRPGDGAQTTAFRPERIF